MPNANVRADARIVPNDARLRARLAAAAERLIAALDALDAPDEDLEDSHDAEAYADDEEPSLGSTNAMNQEAAWRNTFSDTDLELDDSESGIGDPDGLAEQTVGEPSLGATLDMDQRIAWGADRAAGLVDGEATGTEDDLCTWKTREAWQADRAVAGETRDRLQAIVRRRRASEGRAHL